MEFTAPKAGSSFSLRPPQLCCMAGWLDGDSPPASSTSAVVTSSFPGTTRSNHRVSQSVSQPTVVVSIARKFLPTGQIELDARKPDTSRWPERRTGKEGIVSGRFVRYGMQPRKISCTASIAVFQTQNRDKYILPCSTSFLRAIYSPLRK